jgi:hypothetical protein
MTTTPEQIEAVARAIANDDDWWEDYTLYAERAIDTITSLIAEVEQSATDLEEYRRDVERLRAALLVARKYVLVQSCELSLMPDDAARDLDVIDEALEVDDD